MVLFIISYIVHIIFRSIKNPDAEFYTNAAFYISIACKLMRKPNQPPLAVSYREHPDSPLL